MPIEIRELLIRANIREDGSDGGAVQAKDEDRSNNTPDTRTIVKECAELVIEMLQQRSGR